MKLPENYFLQFTLLLLEVASATISSIQSSIQPRAPNFQYFER